MAIDKTGSGAPTNSVPVSVGKTAAEGRAQGERANAEFNRGMEQPARPRPYVPPDQGPDAKPFGR